MPIGVLMLCLLQHEMGGSIIGAEPLGAGTVISSGTLTDAQFIALGESWSAVVDGLDVARVSVTTGV